MLAPEHLHQLDGAIGARIIVGDHVSTPIGGASRYAAATVQYASPAEHPVQFAEQIATIVRRFDVGVVIPATDLTLTAIYKVSTSQTQTHTLGAIADAFVRDGSTYAGQNFGSATDLQVKTDAVGWNRYSYLTFNLATLGDDITSGKLRLNARLDNANAVCIQHLLIEIALQLLFERSKPRLLRVGVDKVGQLEVAGRHLQGGAHETP